ncbi:MAG: hypothetical protein HY231_18560 [Acidobacteria bacterium]|nr:hypothetical protein [Acidobacteriota bacterium]
MTDDKKPVEESVEKRSGSDRRQSERRDTAREKEKGVLTTRTTERRQDGRRKADRKES